MDKCENPDNLLAMNIKFYIKSPYFDVKDKFVSTKSATFSHRNPNQRWIGPFNLFATDDLFSNRSKNYFLNDSLTIGCELDVNTSRLSSSKWPSRIPDTIDESGNNTEKFYIKKRSQKHLSHSQSSLTYQIDAKEEESLHKFTLTGHTQINESNKKISRGSQTWEQKLVQLSNEKAERNLRSEASKMSRGSQTWNQTLLQSSNVRTGHNLRSKESERSAIETESSARDAG